MMIKVFFAALLAVSLVSGWPTGAPSKACEAMLPHHGQNRPQPAHLSPYTLTQSTDSYRPGDQVIVYVQAPAGTPFKGMMVQAYDPRTNSTIGEFLEGTGLKKLSECASMSHADNRDKKSATLVWVAPKILEMLDSGLQLFNNSTHFIPDCLLQCKELKIKEFPHLIVHKDLFQRSMYFIVNF